MVTALIVPVTITPEAAERVAELGMQTELERMLEHTKQAVDGLLRIDVNLAPPYDTGDEPGILIEPVSCKSFRLGDAADRAWGEWKIDTFPPDVCRHFAMLPCWENNHAG